MTDKNLADECERLANKLAALIEASPGPGTLLEAMNALDRAAAAIRAIAAPQSDIAAREEVAKWMLAHSYATGHGDTISDLLHELVGQAEAAGQAARAKRDAEIVRTYGGGEDIAEMIEKDAAG